MIHIIKGGEVSSIDRSIGRASTGSSSSSVVVDRRPASCARDAFGSPTSTRGGVRGDDGDSARGARTDGRPGTTGDDDDDDDG